VALQGGQKECLIVLMLNGDKPQKGRNRGEGMSTAEGRRVWRRESGAKKIKKGDVLSYSLYPRKKASNQSISSRARQVDLGSENLLPIGRQEKEIALRRWHALKQGTPGPVKENHDQKHKNMQEGRFFVENITMKSRDGDMRRAEGGIDHKP